MPESSKTVPWVAPKPDLLESPKEYGKCYLHTFELILKGFNVYRLIVECVIAVTRPKRVRAIILFIVAVERVDTTSLHFKLLPPPTKLTKLPTPECAKWRA